MGLIYKSGHGTAATTMGVNTEAAAQSRPPLSNVFPRELYWQGALVTFTMFFGKRACLRFMICKQFMRHKITQLKMFRLLFVPANECSIFCTVPVDFHVCETYDTVHLFVSYEWFI